MLSLVWFYQIPGKLDKEVDVDMKKDTSEFMEENVMDEAVYGEACQDTDSLSTYLTEIGRYKLLSNEEICELLIFFRVFVMPTAQTQ